MAAAFTVEVYDGDAWQTVSYMTGALSVESSVRERSVCKFATNMDRASGQDLLVQGAKVRVTNNATGSVDFTGFIEDVKEERFQFSDRDVFRVTVADNHYLADKRVVRETYKSATTDEMVQDIVERYLADEGVRGNPLRAQVMADDPVAYWRLGETYQAYRQEVLNDSPTAYWRLGEKDYSATILGDNPAAYWRLGESSGTTAVDETGNGNDGTYVNSPTLGVSGAVGTSSDTSVDFDGTDDYVDCPFVVDPGASSFTAEAWVNPDTVSLGGDYMVVFQQQDGTGTGRTWLYQRDDKFASFLGGTELITASVAVTGEWFHVVLTYDASTGDRKLYVNGVQEASDTITAESSDGGLLIGRQTADSQYWDGTIDEPTVYTDALTSTQVSDHYSKATLIADETSNANDGTAIGGLAMEQTGVTLGDTDTAVNFDGSDDYVDVPHHSTLSGMGSEASVEAWVKLDGTQRSQARILTKYDGSILEYFLAMRTDGETPRFLVDLDDGSGGTTRFQVNGSVNLNDGTWHHLVGTYDANDGPDGTVAIYVDGVLDNSIPGNGNTIATNTVAVNIAWSEGGGYTFDGDIDEAAVYPVALSAEDVQGHYDNGRRIMPDYTGNGHDGEAFGRPTLGTSGALVVDDDGAVDFDGSDDFTESDSIGAASLDSFTYEAWFQTTFSGSYTYVIGEGDSVSDAPRGIFGFANTDEFRFGVMDDTGTTVLAQTSTTYNDGSWHHAVGVRDGNTLRLYLDGTEVATADASSLGTVTVDRTAVAMSPRSTDTNHFPGIIDEPAIYSTVLTADRIQAHYEAGTQQFIDAGPTVEEAIFDYRSAAEVIDKIAEAANHEWWIDEQAILRVRDRATTTGPWNPTEADMIHESIQPRRGNPRYRNRQFIKGGMNTTNQQVEEELGDGDQRAFTVGYPIAEEPTVEVDYGDDGSFVEESVGIKGLESNHDWYWSKGDATITQDTDNAKLTSTDRLRVTYIGQFPLAARVDDFAEQALVEELQDTTTGIVESVKSSPPVASRSAVISAASRKLERWAQRGRRLKFSTRRSGLKGGQLVTVNAPSFGFDGVEMLVTKVKAKDKSSRAVYVVTLAEGPAQKTWTSLFEDIAGLGRDILDKLQVGESETVAILKTFSAETDWQESHTETAQSCPVPSSTQYPSSTLYPC